MSQTQEETSNSFPRTYVVSPPIKAMRVPVVYNPAHGNDVIVYLKTGTVITVLSRSELWLHIQLPGSRTGYIQAAYAQPATAQEQQAAMAVNASQPGVTKQSAIVSTSEGLTRGWRPGPNLQTAFNWFKFAVGCFFLSLLCGFVAVHSCQPGDTQCAGSQGPIVTIAVILFFASLVFFVVSIIVGIVLLVQNRIMR
jgi:hypothetical protein